MKKIHMIITRFVPLTLAGLKQAVRKLGIIRIHQEYPLRIEKSRPLHLNLAGDSFLSSLSGLFPAILGKGPLQKLGKNDRLNIKLVKINDTEHNKDSKIYPQNQVILDCIMSSIPLKHKCFSIILIWVIVSNK